MRVVQIFHVFGDDDGLVEAVVGDLTIGRPVAIGCEDGGLELVKRVCASTLWAEPMTVTTTGLNRLDVALADRLVAHGAHRVVSVGTGPLSDRLATALGDVVTVHRCNRQDVLPTMKRRARTAGVRLDADVWPLMAGLVDVDTRAGWSLLSAVSVGEVDTVDREMFNQLCPLVAAGRPWAALQAIVDGDVKRAVDEIGSELHRFIGFASRTVEDVLGECDGRTGRSAGRQLRTTMRQRWGWDGLVAALNRIDEADRLSKRGGGDDRAIATWLAAALSQLGLAAAPAGA